MKLDARIARDTANATGAAHAARTELDRQKAPNFRPTVDMVRGAPAPQLDVLRGLESATHALQSIADDPFHAMLEAEIEGPQGRTTVLWYANKNTRANHVLPADDAEIKVLAWTHPGFQKGLTGELDEWAHFRRTGLAVTGVRPFARARFTQTAPAVAGLYDPGGKVDGFPGPPERAAAGLKSVKLDMTPEQVEAFIARMDGLLLVTGAPGTGKTTVALQRIRFLLDQQQLREPRSHVLYAPDLTRVFLASDNLMSYTRNLLSNELAVPSDVVSPVPKFIEAYLDHVWASRGRSRPIARRMSIQVQRARHAMLNLCTAKDLRGVWSAVEDQARRRLTNTSAADWMHVTPTVGSARAATVLAESLADIPPHAADDPVASVVRMDQLWRRVRAPYDECRRAMVQENRDRFDRTFLNWLYWVFNPVDVLRTYFGDRRNQAVELIRRGVPELATPQKVVDEVLACIIHEGRESVTDGACLTASGASRTWRRARQEA